MHAQCSASLDPLRPPSLRVLRFAAEFLADAAFERGPWPRLLALWSGARGLSEDEAAELRRVILRRRRRP